MTGSRRPGRGSAPGGGWSRATVPAAPPPAAHKSIITGEPKVLFHVSFSVVQNSIVTGGLLVATGLKLLFHVRLSSGNWEGNGPVRPSEERRALPWRSPVNCRLKVLVNGGFVHGALEVFLQVSFSIRILRMVPRDRPSSAAPCRAHV